MSRRAGVVWRAVAWKYERAGHSGGSAHHGERRWEPIWRAACLGAGSHGSDDAKSFRLGPTSCPRTIGRPPRHTSDRRRRVALRVPRTAGVGVHVWLVVDPQWYCQISSAHVPGIWGCRPTSPRPSRPGLWSPAASVGGASPTRCSGGCNAAHAGAGRPTCGRGAGPFGELLGGHDVYQAVACLDRYLTLVASQPRRREGMPHIRLHVVLYDAAAIGV